MPKTNYENTTFFKIINPNTSYTFIDYSTNFRHKKCMHKRYAKQQKQCEPYTIINEFGGWDNWNIEIIETIDCKNRKNAENHLTLLRFNSSLKPNDNVESEMFDIVESGSARNSCIHCNKTFSRKDSAIRHMKMNICILKKSKPTSNEKLKQENSELKKQLKKFQNQTTNITTNYNSTTNINTINNTVNIIELGKENLSSVLTHEQQKQILRKRYHCLTYLIECIHYNDNPKYKQFQNISITNMNNPYAYQFKSKEKKFVMVSKESLLDNVMTSRLDDIVEFYQINKHDETLDKITVDSVRRFINDMDEEDKRKNKMKDIKLTMYNNRDKVDISNDTLYIV